MTILMPDTAPKRDWKDRLGFSRDELIEKILRDGWFVYPDRRSMIYVEELEHFGLKISSLENDTQLLEYKTRDIRPKQGPYAELHPRFEVIFDYFKRPHDIRIRNVFFESLAHQGLGKKFLYAVVSTALDINGHNIYVEPGIEGSVYWPSRGAQIQYWPAGEVELEERAQALIQGKCIVIGDWTQDESDNLQSIFRRHDLDGLNRLFDRENILVFQDNKYVPLRRYLFENIMLDACVFDFDHPLTQKRLLRRVGIDIVAERAARGSFVPELPVGGSLGSAHSALMLACH